MISYLSLPFQLIKIGQISCFDKGHTIRQYDTFRQDSKKFSSYIRMLITFFMSRYKA